MYEAALAGPDTLAAFAQSPYAGAVLECEDLLRAPTFAHLRSGARGAPPGSPPVRGGEPRGTPWEEEDLERLFPKISARLMLP